MQSNLLDLYFWRTIIYTGFPIVIALIWLRSGRSPLFWISVGAAWLEAVRLQFCRSCVVAYGDFKKRLPDTVSETRGEIGAFGG